MIEAYEIHCRNLASSREMGAAGIGIRNLRYDLLVVVHGQKIGYVVHPVRTFLDVDTSLSKLLPGNLAKLVHVETHMTLGHLFGLPADKTTAGEAEEVCIGIPVFRLSCGR